MNDDLAQIYADYADNKVDDADKIWQKADPLFMTALKGCTKNGVYGDFQKLADYQNATLSRKDAKKYI